MRSTLRKTPNTHWGNTKHQTPNTRKASKFQTPTGADPRIGRGANAEILELGAWSFFGVWCLVFGVLEKVSGVLKKVERPFASLALLIVVLSGCTSAPRALD